MKSGQLLNLVFNGSLATRLQAKWLAFNVKHRLLVNKANNAGGESLSSVSTIQSFSNNNSPHSSSSFWQLMTPSHLEDCGMQVPVLHWNSSAEHVTHSQLHVARFKRPTPWWREIYRWYEYVIFQWFIGELLKLATWLCAHQSGC